MIERLWQCITCSISECASYSILHVLRLTRLHAVHTMRWLEMHIQIGNLSLFLLFNSQFYNLFLKMSSIKGFYYRASPAWEWNIFKFTPLSQSSTHLMLLSQLKSNRSTILVVIFFSWVGGHEIKWRKATKPWWNQYMTHNCLDQWYNVCY